MRGIEVLAAVNRSAGPMADALPEMPVRETVMVRLIRACMAGMGQYFEPVFRVIALQENAFHVLCLLLAAEHGKASPSELADLVGLSRANMTRVLDGLVAEGYVTRSVEERDARRFAIQITPAGRKMAMRAVPRMAGPLAQAFAGLNEEEMVQFDALLRKAIQSFDQMPFPLRASA